MKPIDAAERHQTLDVLRGFALYGVLIVNLLGFFRVSLFEGIANHHTHPGWANHLVDDLTSKLLEFKSMEIFSLTFGISVAIQFQRTSETFLLRRFAVLLALGTLHMVLISNVDILMLYACCGLILIPLLRLPAVVLAILGAAAIQGPAIWRGDSLPPLPVMTSHAAEATRVYSHSRFFVDLIPYRWQETVHFIAALDLGSAQRTVGLMLLGVAVWRSGIVRDRPKWLWAVAAAGAAYGIYFNQDVPLALAYASAIIALGPKTWLSPLAALGRMALTSYLTQTIALALIFTGFGLIGLHLAPFPTAVFGTAFYLAQIACSVRWLQHHRYGPFEWLWRSMSYGIRL